MARYEAHITVDKQHARVTEIVGDDFGWVFSVISGCPLLGQGTYCYLTSYNTDGPTLLHRMERVVDHLEAHGVPVLRSKMELIVYDTKTGHRDTPCVVGMYCEKHEGVHGTEAEELRKKLEHLLDQGDYELAFPQLARQILDEVDARDSLAFLETQEPLNNVQTGKAGE